MVSIFIKRTKLKELNDKVNELCSNMKVITAQIESLNDAHVCVYESHTERNSVFLVSHKEARYHMPSEVNTSKIKGLTLEELAKYVLDGTPIKRQKVMDIEYKNDKKSCPLML